MKHKYEIKQLLILLCILKLYKKSNWLSSCTKTRTIKENGQTCPGKVKQSRAFLCFHLMIQFNFITRLRQLSMESKSLRFGVSSFMSCVKQWDSQRSGEKYRVQFHRMITFYFNQLKWPFYMFKFSYYFSLRH